MRILQESILNCHSCQLRSSCTRPVVGHSSAPTNSKPPVLVVGEAPGQEEDLQGVPFVGKSGKLLRDTLLAASDERPNIFYITNTVKCRPVNNATPSLEQSMQCASNHLIREIEILQPSVVLCVGKVASTAMKALFNQDAGPAINVDYSVKFNDSQIGVHGVFHPAYVLRSNQSNNQLKDAWTERIRSIINRYI
jgi:uracil-DNA glycosylase family 4